MQNCDAHTLQWVPCVHTKGQNKISALLNSAIQLLRVVIKLRCEKDQCKQFTSARNDLASNYNALN